MSNKTPFELRTEILSMAKEYMDKQFELQVDYTKKMADLGKQTVEEFPTMYTVEELTAKAQELYAFVTKKG